jgi:hypothetical protein
VVQTRKPDTSRCRMINTASDLCRHISKARSWMVLNRIYSLETCVCLGLDSFSWQLIFEMMHKDLAEDVSSLIILMTTSLTTTVLRGFCVLSWLRRKVTTMSCDTSRGQSVRRMSRMRFPSLLASGDGKRLCGLFGLVSTTATRTAG